MWILFIVFFLDEGTYPYSYPTGAWRYETLAACEEALEQRRGGGPPDGWDRRVRFVAGQCVTPEDQSNRPAGG